MNELSKNQKVNSSKIEESFYLLSQFNQARYLGETLGSSTTAEKEISDRDKVSTREIN